MAATHSAHLPTEVMPQLSPPSQGFPGLPPGGQVTRFAPSPTGYLHLGHAHAALFAAAAAQRGRFLLRIEDIDPTRCRPEYSIAIEEDLEWLGLRWEKPVRHQSRHLADYRQSLARLDAQGLLYPCFCSRGDIAREIAEMGYAPHYAQHVALDAATTAERADFPPGMGPDGPLYPGTCRRLSTDERQQKLKAGLPHVLRLDMAAACAGASDLSYREWHAASGSWQQHKCHPQAFGDVVLARKDVPASYHLCVTHDDALQGITLVTRGEDLRAATAIHRLLQHLLGLPEPGYAFHPLLLDAAGQRLAKRAGAPSLRQMREAGASAAELRALAGFSSG